jgi:two-component system C4-dicarboxylate transport sensor histidine kinase DctB
MNEEMPIAQPAAVSAFEFVHRRPLARAALRILVAGVLLAVAVGVLGYRGIDRWVVSRAVSQAHAAATQTARANAGLLDSELQKFRLLPTVLAEYNDVQALLADGSADAAAKLDTKLESLAAKTNAAVIYVLDQRGVTVAASNWRQPNSFVGQDYSFRPYFSGAEASGEAEMFALGTISHRPGLFFSRRVDHVDAAGKARPIGVVVVKVEFGPLERSWTHQPGATLVTDASGVVVITSRPDWRFHATRPLSPERVRHFRAIRQFGEGPIARVPLNHDDEPFTRVSRDTGERFVAGEAPILIERWRLLYLAPLDTVLAAAHGEARAIALSAALLTAFLVGLVVVWRDRQALRVETRRALESEVALRTAELSQANAQLTIESAERQQADRRFRRAREELAQANRLGSLGQITASVAHEINQPVAAIRTYAENAALMLNRANPDGAAANLDRIVALTGRVGSITAELRAFARRGTPPTDRVTLARLIEGTLLLIGDALRGAGVTFDAHAAERCDVAVIADRVRLEQVMINLLQNAIDAMAGRPDPRIVLGVQLAGDTVRLTLADNGPGITDEVAQTLFNPFVTTKPAGLGLGLGIARDIVREFGGELSVVSSPLGGAAFQLRLRRA